MVSFDTEIRRTGMDPETVSRRSDGMSFSSAVFNLANTIIGSGTLTMPFVFAKCGWLPANLFGIVAMVVTTYSAYLLALASDRAGGDVSRSFESLGYHCCGIPGSVYAEATFILGGLGTLTGYMIFVGKLAAQVMGIGQDRAYIPIIGVLLLVILPLTWPRKINALRFSSLAAVFAIAYVMVMYVVFCARIGRYDNDPSGKFRYVDVQAIALSLESINSVNLMVGAFCVQNTCLPIYGELTDRSPGKLVRAILGAMLISCCIYEAIGLSGYLLFGANVAGNSLLNFDASFADEYPQTRAWCVVAKVSMVCLLSFSFPLAIWPCRSALCSVILRVRAGCTGPARGSDFATPRTFRSVTVCVLIIVGTLAILIPDVTIPLGMVNSLAGGSMIFVMPGLFYLGSIEDKSERFSLRQWRIFAMIAMGLLVCVVGFSLQVLSILRKYGYVHGSDLQYS